MRRVVLACLPLVVISALGCSSSPQSPPYQTVVDSRTLMNAVIEKQANVLWESVGTIQTLEHTEDRRPRTDADWANLRDAAIMVAESGNLLMLGSRARDGDEWMKSAAGLALEGQRAIAAIDRKDPQQLFDVGADLYDACVRCHMHYMPGVADKYR